MTWLWSYSWTPHKQMRRSDRTDDYTCAACGYCISQKEMHLGQRPTPGCSGET